MRLIVVMTKKANADDVIKNLNRPIYFIVAPLIVIYVAYYLLFFHAAVVDLKYGFAKT